MSSYTFDEIPDDEYRDGYPSTRRALLQRLVGKRVLGITRYIYNPIEFEISEYKHLPNRIFPDALGGVAVEVEGGMMVSFGSESSWGSVVLNLVRNDWQDPHFNQQEVDPDEVAIQADDPTYSEPRYAALLGKRLASITVLQVYREGREPGWYPEEEAVVLAADDGSELVLWHDDDFFALTREEMRPDVMARLRPIFTLTAE